ncbi:hypothetical protein CYMTET_41363 [Cymbomonas tetramitiformis]|uniref:Uncharacterized protein n=1 Tax=Cymbomonas tetramitiformis TaxID=36881 RepID=A0AAE0F2Q7_9CHLO|nr:hypothetical protein CYMTET_41363 [Cymbomonas tetramitiformis]
MLASPSAARNLDRRSHAGTVAERNQSEGSDAAHDGEPSSIGDEGNAEGERWNGVIVVVEQLEGTRDGAPDGMAASSPPRPRGELQERHPQKEARQSTIPHLSAPTTSPTRVWAAPSALGTYRRVNRSGQHVSEQNCSKLRKPFGGSCLPGGVS